MDGLALGAEIVYSRKLHYNVTINVKFSDENVHFNITTNVKFSVENVYPSDFIK